MSGEEQRQLLGVTQLAGDPIAGGDLVIDGEHETVTGNGRVWTWINLDRLTR